MSPWALLLAVVAVGVLHTMVPDHWAPIVLLARQRGWTTARTARTAAIAGTGHTLSTLAIGIVVWIAGIALAARIGRAIDLVSGIALVGFGLWIAVSAWREIGHQHEESSRAALLLILGSSPMIEGIPAFFAAGRYGLGLLAIMAMLFAAATITTYVLLCIAALRGMEGLRFGRLEEYGEVLSGALIALLGAAFLFVR